jgi:hypothetical protein
MSGFLPILSTVTADDVATAVRAELATELGRIDAAVSTRSTVAAIRTELSTELGRIDAAISTRSTVAAIQAAVIPVNITKVNSVTITGTGVPSVNEWRPV